MIFSRKKVTTNKITLQSGILLSVVSFFVGLALAYFSITHTDNSVINYRLKFEELYRQNKKDTLYETYIDLAKGIMFNYPSYYRVDEGLYDPNEVFGDSQMILEVVEGDTYFTLLKYKVVNNQSLLDFAKKSKIFNHQNLRKVSYTETTLNGYEVVMGDFVVTEEQKQITDFVKGAMVKVIEEPIGFKGKLVYIKHQDYFYVWKTGLIGNLGRELDFHFIAENFRFIF